MGTRKSNQNFIAWSLVAIVLLLGTSAYLWWNTMQLNKDLDIYKQELSAVETTQGLLEKDYELAMQSLEDLKGDNADLNKLIDQQKAELKTQKEKISNLIWKSKKLKLAKKEIENLKNQALGYVDQINKLKEENLGLTAENTELKTTTSNLQTELADVSSQKEIISSEKDSIILVKNELTSQNKVLLRKATKASVIEVDEIDVTGYKIKEDGTLKKKRRAKNINVLEICFNMLPNEISDLPSETFKIRIINPSGATVYKKELGGGTFTKSSDGTETRFTTKATFSVKEGDELVCAKYESKEAMQKGLYLLEIYNKDYVSGTGSFKLR